MPVRQVLIKGQGSTSFKCSLKTHFVIKYVFYVHNHFFMYLYIIYYVTIIMISERLGNMNLWKN